jgi:hypothetical protein
MLSLFNCYIVADSRCRFEMSIDMCLEPFRSKFDFGAK